MTAAPTSARTGGTVPDLRAATVAQAPGPGRGPRRLTGRGIVLLVVGVVIAVVYLLPFYVAIVNSFKTDEDASLHPLALPTTWTGAAFRTLFENSDFGVWTMNSVIVAVVVTLGRIFFDSLAGYALARIRFPGRQTVFALIVAVMAVPAVVLLIPKFLVINQLGMYDSYSGMIIPLLVDAAGVFIMKNFFESIPVSVEEQAKIDGAGVFRTFWSIVLPMARPAVVTITILSFQGSWNELPHFIVSASSPGLTTLTKGVASLASGALSAGNQFPIKLAAAFVMTIPVAVAFFVFQRRIMNTSDGAVKE
ncbi:carbohydrate ABC transporter permease [Curtobacterium sp. Csp1]|uniref:Carbohydrate ABC transporter permease n=1 Tax=Curtobacterium citreum TaxID=2036 RepID=A0ABT2HJW2_9MICO|nr:MULTISPECIES: carbohydrate ABC transporter permease [Curtobacterium]MCS5485931.1 carbohydrate ABC transporter permease [Curtobacterium flaccumfaciens pv. basellae]MCS6523563.1 carbohydrate ABC transporter permease [Curtobacterium citreum]QKS12655.1 carbohydrate ABC transporter permease [Curtobacterium sp. csp3]QKS17783.1 carbohydrate ABC transporter permease [Curtobacterium sp. Csp2]QKS20272.1 carbohydrate ABC transporter permease [Curtobacterium sp. Csp1]